MSVERLLKGAAPRADAAGLDLVQEGPEVFAIRDRETGLAVCQELGSYGTPARLLFEHGLLDQVSWADLGLDDGEGVLPAVIALRRRDTCTYGEVHMCSDEWSPIRLINCWEGASACLDGRVKRQQRALSVCPHEVDEVVGAAGMDCFRCGRYFTMPGRTFCPGCGSETCAECGSFRPCKCDALRGSLGAVQTSPTQVADVSRYWVRDAASNSPFGIIKGIS